MVTEFDPAKVSKLVYCEGNDGFDNVRVKSM